jgi:IclR family transcriptional regulator, acetate operon repressor
MPRTLTIGVLQIHVVVVLKSAASIAPAHSFLYHTAMQRRSTAINVVSKATQVLKACQLLGDHLSLGDIARHVGLPRSTVQRIVSTLVREGFLATDGSAKSIRLGPEILAMVEKVQPILKKISAETGETVDLARFNRDHMVFVNQIPGSHRLRAVSAVGDIFPLHCTANGKAVLAQLPHDEVRLFIRQQHRKYTPNTITTARELARAISETRQRGIAFDMEEHTLGICAVGAAVRDKADQFYAVSIPVPSVRFRQSRARCEAALLGAIEPLAKILQH